VWVTAGSGQQVAVVVNGGTRPLPRVNLPHLCRPMTANMETNQKCGEGHTKLRAETRVWLRRRERQLLLLNDCMCCRKVGLLPGADPRCGSSACSSSEYNSVGTMGSSCNLEALPRPNIRTRCQLHPTHNRFTRAAGFSSGWMVGAEWRGGAE